MWLKLYIYTTFTKMDTENIIPQIKYQATFSFSSPNAISISCDISRVSCMAFKAIIQPIGELIRVGNPTKIAIKSSSTKHKSRGPSLGCSDDVNTCGGSYCSQVTFGR